MNIVLATHNRLAYKQMTPKNFFHTLIRMILPSAVVNIISQQRLLAILPKEIQKIIRQLNSESVCIDCGANVGDVSGLFASYGAKVYAFEPNPYAFEKLREKSQKEPLITPIQKAVGTNSSAVNLYLHNDSNMDPSTYSTASSLLSEKPNVSAENFIEVESENLTNFLASFAHVDILKVDIEGFEVELIPDLIRKKALENVSHIFVETHDHKWSNLKLQSDQMRKLASTSEYGRKIRFDWP